MTNLKQSKSNVNVGVDVGKFELDVCIYEKQFIGEMKIPLKVLSVF